MRLTHFSAGILLGVSAFFYGCDRITPLPEAPPTSLAHSPARDELYLFDHGRLGMSAYEELRKLYPDVSPYDLSRLAMAAQWLTEKTPPRKTIPLIETTRCVRVLFPPQISASEEKRALKTLNEGFGISSFKNLREDFDNAASGWTIQWNPSLLREYQITPPTAARNTG
jgi:hypothetical protein